MLVKSFFNVVSLLAIAASTGVAFAGSEKKSPYVDDEGYCVVDIAPSNPSRYVQQKVIDVPDIKGHVVLVEENEQKIKYTKLCNGDSLVLSNGYNMTDYIDEDGSVSGYRIFSTEKGDQLFFKVTANSQKKLGEDLSDYQSTGRIIGGTGALVAAEGDYQSIAKFNRNRGVIQPIMKKLRYKIVAKDAKK